MDTSIIRNKSNEVHRKHMKTTRRLRVITYTIFYSILAFLVITSALKLFNY